MRRWAIDHGGQPRHAEPARIGTTDAHIHGNGFAQHFLGHLMDVAHDGQGRVGVVGFKAAQHAPGNAGQRIQSLMQRCQQPRTGHTHRQADIAGRAGRCRHQIGRGAAFDAPDIDRDTAEHRSFSGAR